MRTSVAPRFYNREKVFMGRDIYDFGAFYLKPSPAVFLLRPAFGILLPFGNFRVAHRKTVDRNNAFGRDVDDRKVFCVNSLCIQFRHEDMRQLIDNCICGFKII